MLKRLSKVFSLTHCRGLDCRGCGTTADVPRQRSKYFCGSTAAVPPPWQHNSGKQKYCCRSTAAVRPPRQVHSGRDRKISIACMPRLGHRGTITAAEKDLAFSAAPHKEPISKRASV
ncbi:hypothetical protein Q3G72_001516 [Acer saccharum]|nr:hypothetical protein Q3G72_001516 [Acer saccharum]